MPDHIHLFATLNESFEPFVEFDAWVRFWKSQFAKAHGNSDWRWQTDHWDRRLRRDEDYDEKWFYVRNNPLRHKLVEDADDWPYQGEVFEFRWE